MFQSSLELQSFALYFLSCMCICVTSQNFVEHEKSVRNWIIPSECFCLIKFRRTELGLQNKKFPHFAFYIFCAVFQLVESHPEIEKRCLEQIPSNGMLQNLLRRNVN